MTFADNRRAVFLLLAAPFILNDLVFIWLNGSYAIYPVDYAIRLMVLIVCFTWPASHAALHLEPPKPVSIPLALSAIIILPTLCWLFFWYLISPATAVIGSRRLFRFPEIENATLYAFDLTMGLFLVALSEELIFRKLSYAWLSKAGFTTLQIVLCSAVFFSITHWAGGVLSLANTFIMGVLYMIAYVKLRRLWPLVIAHWIHNFLYFGQI